MTIGESLTTLYFASRACSTDLIQAIVELIFGVKRSIPHIEKRLYLMVACARSSHRPPLFDDRTHSYILKRVDEWLLSQTFAFGQSKEDMQGLVTVTKEMKENLVAKGFDLSDFDKAQKEIKCAHVTVYHGISQYLRD